MIEINEAYAPVDSPQMQLLMRRAQIKLLERSAWFRGSQRRSSMQEMCSCVKRFAGESPDVRANAKVSVTAGQADDRNTYMTSRRGLNSVGGSIQAREV